MYQECNLGKSCGILIIGKGQSPMDYLLSATSNQPLKKGVGYD